MIPRSRRSLCSFDKEGNTSTKANRSHAGGVLHAVRWCAPGMVQCRGKWRWGTVVGVCLVPEGGVYKKLSRRSQVVLGLGEVIRSNL